MDECGRVYACMGKRKGRVQIWFLVYFAQKPLYISIVIKVVLVNGVICLFLLLLKFSFSCKIGTYILQLKTNIVCICVRCLYELCQHKLCHRHSTAPLFMVIYLHSFIIVYYTHTTQTMACSLYYFFALVLSLSLLSFFSIFIFCLDKTKYDVNILLFAHYAYIFSEERCECVSILSF